MDPINVVTFGLPKLLQVILIERLDKQADVDLVGHFVSFAEFDKERDSREPHVVIVEAQKERECKTILYKYPEVRVISLLHSGEGCTIWQLIARKQELGEVSPDQLVGVISKFKTPPLCGVYRPQDFNNPI